MGVTNENPMRVAWIDVARGLCIILVVFLHFDKMHFSQLDGPPLAISVWHLFATAMRPARMPAFFMISGVLAISTVMAEEKKKFANRIYFLGYLYIVWSIIYYLFFNILDRSIDLSLSLDSVKHILIELIWSGIYVWYLLALTIFLAICRIFRSRYPVLLIFGAILSISYKNIDNYVMSEMARCFVFFLIGVAFSNVIRSKISKPRISLIVFLSTIYLIFMLALFALSNSALLWFPAAIVGVTLVFQISYILTYTRLRPILSYVGKNTLPIYVMHSAIIIAIDHSWAVSEIESVLTALPFMAWGYPIIGNSLIIVACLLLNVAVRRIGVDGIFSLPSRKYQAKSTAYISEKA